MIRDGVNVAVLGVYWFLLAVAVVFAGMALWELNKLRTRQPVQARVVERSVRVEVRELRGKRGLYKTLYATADLRVEPGGAMAEERMINKDELISHSFLDRWTPGAVLTEEVPAWMPTFGFGVCAALFGTFAWLARPFAYGDIESGMGMKILVLALFPIGVAGFGIWANVEKSKVTRTAVMGKGREMVWGDFAAELRGMGVTLSAEVGPFVDKEKVQFCEFPWEGRTVRSVSLFCQKGEGEACEARVNVADVRDVKWGEEQ